MPSTPEPSAPSPTSGTATGGRGEVLLDRLAHYIKMVSLYPLESERVQTAFQEVSEAADALGVVTIRFKESFVKVGRDEVAHGSNDRSRWMAEKARDIGVSMLRLPNGDLATGLPVLARWLLDAANGIRQGRTVPPFPAEEAGGVRVRELRFDGRFGDVAPTEDEDKAGPESGEQAGNQSTDRIARLETEDEIEERLDRIIDRLVQTQHDGPEALDIEERIKRSILHFVVHSLPDDIREDYEQTAELTEGMLDAVETWLDRQGLSRREIASLTETEIRSTVYAASRMYFGRSDQPKTRKVEEDDSPRRRGHAGDDEVGEDLPALVREMRSLPAWTRGDLVLSDLRNPDEELRVILRYVAHDLEDASRQGLMRRLTRRLSRAGPNEFDAVARMAQRLLVRADMAGGLDRMVALFQEARLAWVLHRAGVLHPDMVVETFPSGFVPYLDALVVMDERERSELRDVIRQVGAKPFGDPATREALAADGLFEPDRASRLLGRPLPEHAPLVRLFLEETPGPHDAQVHEWIRQVRGSQGTACLTLLPYDPEIHTPEWLAALVEMGPGGAVDDLIKAHTAQTLRALADPSRPDASRRACIPALVAWGTKEGVDLLKAMTAGGGIFRFGRSASRDLREEAQGALERLAEEASPHV